VDGFFSMTLRKAAGLISSSSLGSTARADALRGVRSRSDISPIASPALRVASTSSRAPSCLVISSTPESTTYSESPGAPSSMTRSPGTACTRREERHSCATSASVRSANSGTLRTNSCSASSSADGALTA